MVTLTPSRAGAWLINIAKHLSRVPTTDFSLTYLDDLLFAGRCGSLLIKLSADDTELLTHDQVTTYARVCGIDRQSLGVYLATLQAHNCVTANGELTEFEVLPLGRQRVLEATHRIFSNVVPAPSLLQIALPDLLETCLQRPRLHHELMNLLSKGLVESDAEALLELVERHRILGVITLESGEKLYFNGYQFGDRARDIGKALEAVSEPLAEEVDILLDRVKSVPGLLREDARVSEEALRLCIGLGMVDVSEVASPEGNAQFLTSPLLGPPSVGDVVEHLEDDVFHHAKMLLASFKYGELRSRPSRGQIVYPAKLVKALVERGEIGPCTAIGQDYMVLESEGVIRTRQASYRAGAQYVMELRRREPADIVLRLIEPGGSGSLEETCPPQLFLPTTFRGPEVQRADTAADPSSNPELMRMFLEVLRT